MKILFVAAGFLPYTFSENLCNGKLVYALKEAGFEVDVISREDPGVVYGDSLWHSPWLPLECCTYTIRYTLGNKVERLFDTVISSLRLGIFPPVGGVRWARRAYDKAIELHGKKHYDYVLTRSPNDLSHAVGYYFSRKTGVKWIANWNDPADPIWPEPYKHSYSRSVQSRIESRTEKWLKGASINTFPSEQLLAHFKLFFPCLNEKTTKVIPHIGMPESIMPHVVSSSGRHEKLRLCHSGNLSKERDPELLFKSMRELIDEGFDAMQLDIMGRMNDYVADLVKKYALSEFVKFIGSYPYEKALSIMGSYDVLVLIEAIMEKGIFFPSKLTDYAQLRKPILAISPIEGFAHDIIEANGGGISVDNNDCLSIKDGIKKLYISWDSGKLKEEYNSEKLYYNFSEDKIVSMYREMLQ